MQQIKKRIKNALCKCWPELFSRIQFRYMLGKKLDLSNPTGLNAKIMWLKFNTYRDNPLISKCADKYAVREYVSDCGCPEILNELYGVWERAEDVDWDSLPNAFVFKCNHGCGYNWLCPDKHTADRQDAFTKLKQWMDEDYWLEFAELQYRDIPKRIICEKYLGESLTDYKFYCFNGKPLYVLVCVGRKDGQPSHTQDAQDPLFFFFDRDWNLLPFTHDGKEYAGKLHIPRPERLDQMWEAAGKLCRPFPFVRVDLYDADGKVVFGELTFTPSAALDTGRLPETDRLFGELLRLDSCSAD